MHREPPIAPDARGRKHGIRAASGPAYDGVGGLVDVRQVLLERQIGRVALGPEAFVGLLALGARDVSLPGAGGARVGVSVVLRHGMGELVAIQSAAKQGNLPAQPEQYPRRTRS